MEIAEIKLSKKAKVLELPVLARILQRFPELVHILMKILKI